MENLSQIIEKRVAECGSKRESLMPILQDVTADKNFISGEDVLQIASALDISAAEIYGTASFYTFLDVEKRGKYVIRVCKSIIAVMKGKDEIIKTIESMLKIKVGETTHDGKFSLLETNDIGWSDHEPSMLINDEVYTDLTPQKVTQIIETYLNERGSKN